MLGAMWHGPFDIRLKQRPDPVIQKPTDAIVRVSATCVCGSDLWNYRGVNEFTEAVPIGHEYCGVVEAVGSAVSGIRVGQFVVGPFCACCNQCPPCLAGYQSACERLEWYDGCQAELLRVPMADGTLVATPELPDQHLIPSLLALSDVMGTGWHAAVSAQVGPGMTVAVVGDGAVGLCGVLACRELRADRILVMSRNPQRQELAKRFGATDIVAERDEEGVEQVRRLTGGVGADAVLECVGTDASMRQAIGCTRSGALVGFVGVPHGVKLDFGELFRRNVGVHGGMAPAREYLPGLMAKVLHGDIEPGLVFDLTLPLSEVAEGYRAMHERRAIKTLLLP